MLPNSKLPREIAQTKSILQDMKKAKYKCLRLSQAFGVELPNKQVYDKLQRQIELKINILDHRGIVQLKDKLMKGKKCLIAALDELFDIQYAIKRAKISRQCKGDVNKNNCEEQSDDGHTVLPHMQHLMLQTEHLPILDQSFTVTQSSILSCQQVLLESRMCGIQSAFDPKKDQIQRKHDQGKRAKQQMRMKSIKLMNKAFKNIQLPIYTIRNESSQNKMDSILKFVASLRRSMKVQARQQQKVAQGDPLEDESSFSFQQSERIKRMLMLEPQYLKVRQAYERLRMRQEEIQSNVERQVQRRFQEELSRRGLILEQNSEFRIIKLVKSNSKEIQPSIVSTNIVLREVDNNQAYNQITERKILRQNDAKQRPSKKQKERPNLQHQESSNIQPHSFRQVFDSINKGFQKSQSKIKQLRNKRKQIFVDDDEIWKNVQDS